MKKLAKVGFGKYNFLLLYIIYMSTPNHYNTSIEPRDYITANNLDFNEGNIIKYVSRWKQKNGLEDLIKAKNYLDYLIDMNKSYLNDSVEIEINDIRR